MRGTCENCSYLMETPSNRTRVGDILGQVKQCSRCQLLQDVVTPHLSHHDLHNSETTISLYLTDEMPMDINIYTKDNPYIPHIVLHVFKCKLEETIEELPGIAFGRPVARVADDMACTDFIKDQLSNCALHQECEPQVATTLPKRLVQIEPHHNKVRLVTTKGTTGRYAALSYCWGDAEGVLKTTTGTLHSHHGHIPWNEIPKTIQDAIVVSRTIGLQYIWIDSLCIIQDDKDDWETEAAKMADYYSNALLTIGASSAASATEGIFIEREPWYLDTSVLHSNPSGQKHDLLVQRRPYLATFNATEMGPIGERGWTVQENALSKRMVHFTKIALFWECQQVIVSENGCPVLKNAGDVSLIRQFQQEFKWDFALSWHTFVEMYTLRKLTFMKDQLPAIAGIASRLHSSSALRYRAGLWEEFIGLNLTWTVPADVSESASLLQGPSWSWTSIGSSVQFPNGLWAHDKVFCHIEEDPTSKNNPTSFLAAGEHNLRLNGPIQEAVLTFGPAEPSKLHSDTEVGCPNSRYILSLSDSDESEYGKLSIKFSPDTHLAATLVTNENGTSFETVQRSTEQTTPFQTKVSCLWCVQQPPADDAKDFASETVGVVLGRVREGRYCRVGLVSLLGLPGRTDQLEELRETIILV